ncbi:TetR/AcrR family transcriptional regulator [Frankia sp. AiPs1]|uniref:TetR/AcrR family transcriptional regulator n=1 Tax=Frankia sp. AiPs1 TaxID=573493 RepID=UPI002043D5FB|nr:helix-turn-helix domain-containing protein [Frankia sp. AiPs1]MCM3922519.1 TetR/AcrR family transcriptional regulator [Frankia sp. AiPs1]
MSDDRGEATPGRRGGRGARERILRAADRLFYAEGINATGMERLTDVAQVSKRTFYQHFPSKNALVEEYLHRLDTIAAPPRERALARADLLPRDRLLALFADDPPAPTDPADPAGPADPAVGGRRLRGCPFHNAAVETAGTVPAVERAVIRHKAAFTRLLAETAQAAGAPDPAALGRQLAVLFEGATALATSLNDPAPLADARAAAAALIDTALTRPRRAG